MKNILTKVDGGLLEITINRPKALNALNQETLDELNEVFEGMSEEIRVVILTGAGEKAFVAGADIAEMSCNDTPWARRFSLNAHHLFTAIENSPQVVICAVNGYALGGGCELAMCCDIRLCSTKAKFGQPEVGLGIVPGFGGTQRLPRLVGKGIAEEIILTGEMIDAQEAYRIGLANKIYEPESLLPKARAMAGKIISNGPFAISLAKRAVNVGINMDTASAYNYEAELFGACFSTAEQKEGMAAFLEKRKPEYKQNKK